jgi:hypothetical protein
VKIGRLRAAAICGALGIFVSATTLGAAKAATATLLADGTYSTLNDLTRINDGGTVLEFLDLTATQGLSPLSNLTTYQSAGFSVATDTQVGALFSAFGITYNFVPNDFVVLSAAPGSEAQFISHLGGTVAGNTASMGQFIAPGFGSYFCISTGGCPLGSFVYNNNVNLFAGDVGVTLVRTADIGATPLPAALPLFAGGLGLIGLLARRKKRTAAAVA